jgi:hypothetical protein
VTRRLFWIALGATAGVLIARQIGRTAEAWTPRGIADAVGELGERLADLWGDIVAATAEREDELRAALDPGRADGEAAGRHRAESAAAVEQGSG